MLPIRIILIYTLVAIIVFSVLVIGFVQVNNADNKQGIICDIKGCAYHGDPTIPSIGDFRDRILGVMADGRD